MLFKRLLLLLMLSATPAFATSLSVNGSCEVGACNSSDVLQIGGSASDQFNFTYVFANSDTYSGSGTVAATFTQNSSGGLIAAITAANISLTYLGNNTGTQSAKDILQLDFMQFFHTSSAAGSNNSGFEALAGDFEGGYSNASSVTGQGVSNGTRMELLGTFAPPNAFFSSASNQPVSFAATTKLDFLDTVTFGAGSSAGATINVDNVPSSVAPEPSTFILLGTGALGAIGAIRRRYV